MTVFGNFGDVVDFIAEAAVEDSRKCRAEKAIEQTSAAASA